MPGLSLTPAGAKELQQTHPSLASKTFPLDAPGQTVRLSSSGRRLGYCEHVDPSASPAHLRTVVLLPGCPGTRLFTHPSVRRQGWVPGWRLIVLERPGIGLSDPAPLTYTYTDWTRDFREFCIQLGLSHVAVIGFSAGTPFATAIACMAPASPTTSTTQPTATTSMTPSSPARAQPLTPPPADAASAPEQHEQPQLQGEAVPTGTARPAHAGDSTAAATDCSATRTEAGGATAVGAAAAAAGLDAAGGRGAGELSGSGPGADVRPGVQAAASPVCTVDGVALVSAIGPPDTPNKRRGMALLFQFAYWACANAPWLVGWVVRSEAGGLRRRPVAELRKAFAPYSCKADVDALKQPEVEGLFLESALEMYSRGQEDAVLRENLMFAGRPWGFDLARRSAPVAIWQGDRDRGCTPAMAAHLAACMAAGGTGGSPSAGGDTGGRPLAGKPSDKGSGSGSAGPARSGSQGDITEKGGVGGSGGARPMALEQGQSRSSTSGVEVHLVPEQGHMLYFDVWDEVVAWVNGLRAGGWAADGTAAQHVKEGR